MLDNGEPHSKPPNKGNGMRNEGRARRQQTTCPENVTERAPCAFPGALVIFAGSAAATETPLRSHGGSHGPELHL